MAIWNRKSTSSSGESPTSDRHGLPPSKMESQYNAHDYDVEQGTSDDRIGSTDQHTSLHRGLKARHITMIAIGGAIGTGLIIGTGVALARAGYVQNVPERPLQ